MKRIFGQTLQKLKIRSGGLSRSVLQLLLLCLPVLMLCLAGCRGGIVTENTTGESTRQNLPEEERSFTIGVSINSLRSPFMIALKQGIEKAAEEEGIHLILSDCNGDLYTQSSQIQDFVTQKVDGILMEPLDEDALSMAVKEATEAGIPVYCVDTTVQSGEVRCTIGSDSSLMGEMAAEYIVERLKEKYGACRGRVVNLLASVNTTSGRNRSRGFHKVMDQYPDIEIVAEQNGALQLDTAMYAVTNILQANPQVDAIWCSGDTNAQGALRAMRWLGCLTPADQEDHIILVSADGAAETLQAIRDGYIDACISQNPLEMGALAVKTLKRQLTEAALPDQSFLAYPLFVITADNMESEELKEYGIWSEEIEP